MGFDLSVFFAVGMQESFAPTHLATAGVLALGLLLLRKTRLDVLQAYVLNFAVVLIFWGIVLQAGLGAYMTGAPLFKLLTTISYLVCGVGFVLAGGLFWHQWHLLRRDGTASFALCVGCISVSRGVAGLIGTFSALWLVAIAYVWPTGFQAQWQSSMVFLPGRLWDSLTGLVFYEICRNAASVAVLVSFFVIRVCAKNFPARQRSLVLIILSAFYLASGCALVYFFYNRF